MGCTSARDSLSKEELTIMSFEEQLELFKHKGRIVDFVFRKFSEDGKINDSQ